ncbi:MAG TPA: ATP-binding protein [Solirubrobacteraceae bacterium]|jgi:signal transduction histidine kinase|nr:ATP-binding protein [Solirubrobacteraceae bacterium]
MRRVSATGREALVEMRRLLGVLRDEPETGSYEPQPGLDRLDDLLARVEAAGVPVSIELSGNPQELSGGMQLTVFRVTQEALTNTLKHATRPTSAKLSLHCNADLVDLEIVDTGTLEPPNDPDRADLPLAATDDEQSHGLEIPSAGGRGLRGMRERAAAYGGQLEAGPGADGGWRVHLTLTPERAQPMP